MTALMNCNDGSPGSASTTQMRARLGNLVLDKNSTNSAVSPLSNHGISLSSSVVSEVDQIHPLDKVLMQQVFASVPSAENMASHTKRISSLVLDVARCVLDPSADIEIFGSAGSGYWQTGNDIDCSVSVSFETLYKRFYGNYGALDLSTYSRRLCSDAVCAIADYISSIGNPRSLTVIEVIPGATVPIVVLSDCDGQVIDVSINNQLPGYNTRLLAEYGKIDPRVRALVIFVKRWAKSRNLCGAKGGNLSSYAWTLLTIYYLQKCGIVSSLQETAPKGGFTCPYTKSEYSVGFVMASTSGECLSNRSLVELIIGFFNFYSREYAWYKEVVSVRVGGHARPAVRDLTVSSLMKNVKPWRRVHSINIEDPIQIERNLNTVVTVDGFKRLEEALHEVCQKLNGGGLNAFAQLMTATYPPLPNLTRNQPLSTTLSVAIYEERLKRCEAENERLSTLIQKFEKNQTAQDAKIEYLEKSVKRLERTFDFLGNKKDKEILAQQRKLVSFEDETGKSLQSVHIRLKELEDAQYYSNTEDWYNHGDWQDYYGNTGY